MIEFCVLYICVLDILTKYGYDSGANFANFWKLWIFRLGNWKYFYLHTISHEYMNGKWRNVYICLEYFEISSFRFKLNRLHLRSIFVAYLMRARIDWVNQFHLVFGSFDLIHREWSDFFFVIFFEPAAYIFRNECTISLFGRCVWFLSSELNFYYLIKSNEIQSFGRLFK